MQGRYDKNIKCRESYNNNTLGTAAENLLIDMFRCLGHRHQDKNNT